MYRIKLLNVKSQKTFIKEYESYYLYKKALEKYRRSKKLLIIGIEEL